MRAKELACCAEERDAPARYESEINRGARKAAASPERWRKRGSALHCLSPECAVKGLCKSGVVSLVWLAVFSGAPLVVQQGECVGQ